GALVALGLLTRLAALPLAIDMVVAIASTKAPLLWGAGPEPVGAPPKTGLLAFAYQARLDLTMLGACVYLAIVGAGLWSLDAWLAKNRIANALRGSRKDRVDEIDQIASDLPEPDEACWLAFRRAAVRSAVDALPPEQRRALALAYFDDLSNAQVASSLGVPLG